MATWLITHPVFLEHDTGPGHPESPARLQAILDGLSTPEFAALERHEAEPATLDELARVHPRSYIDETLAFIPQRGHRAFDADTVVSPASGEAALRAAGAVRQGVDAVMTGGAERAFCAVRPPGHHAEPDRAMGFCLFNNVAVGAVHAQATHGAQHVAIVDFDVHHGNGTQAMLHGRRGLLYASTHQTPLFPGTGRRRDNREGALYNIPLEPGCDSATFRFRFHNEIVAALMAFEPDLIMVSAGFDAHRADPLAGLNFDERDFAWVTEELVAVANYYCRGRIVSTLEGGYNLAALASSAATHVRVLMR